MGSYRDFWDLDAGTRSTTPSGRCRAPIPPCASGFSTATGASIAIPEVPAVLKRRSRRKGSRLAILSNGSPAMLEAAVRSRRWITVIDEIFSVDAIACFKTDQAVYDLVTTAWRLYPSAVSFQSSNRWDVAGAQKFGLPDRLDQTGPVPARRVIWGPIPRM